MEVHQKKAGPDYHRLKTMVRRSIEQDLRNKNFEARNGNYERNAWSIIRGQNSVNKELQEIVGNGKPTGSVLKETIAVSVPIFIFKRAKLTQPNSSPSSFLQQNVRNAS